MARLERKTQKIFGKNGDKGIFGSRFAGSPTLSDDIDEIQSIAWEDGYEEATYTTEDGRKVPAMEEVQGIAHTLSKQIKYIFQEGGFYDWKNDEPYYIGSFVRKPSTSKIYKSLTDENIGNPLSDVSSWELVADLANISRIIITEENDLLQYATNGVINFPAFSYVDFSYINGSVLETSLQLGPADGGSSNIFILTAWTRKTIRYTGTDCFFVGDWGGSNVWMHHIVFSSPKTYLFDTQNGLFSAPALFSGNGCASLGYIQNALIWWNSSSCNNFSDGITFDNCYYLEEEGLWYFIGADCAKIPYTSKTGIFAHLDTITSSSGGSATVIRDWSDHPRRATDEILIRGITGNFVNGDTITSSSGGSATMSNDPIFVIHRRSFNTTTPLQFGSLSNIRLDPQRHSYGFEYDKNTLLADNNLLIDFSRIRVGGAYADPQYFGNLISPDSLQPDDINVDATACDGAVPNSNIALSAFNRYAGPDGDNSPVTIMNTLGVGEFVNFLFQIDSNARVYAKDAILFEAANVLRIKSYLSIGGAYGVPVAYNNSGLQVGNVIWFEALDGLPAEIIAGQKYFVHSILDATTFQISETLGGAVMTFTAVAGDNYFVHRNGNCAGWFVFVGLKKTTLNISVSTTMYGSGVQDQTIGIAIFDKDNVEIGRRSGNIAEIDPNSPSVISEYESHNFTTGMSFRIITANESGTGDVETRVMECGVIGN